MEWRPVHEVWKEKIKEGMKEIREEIRQILYNDELNSIEKVEAARELESQLNGKKCEILTLLSLYIDGAKIPVGETCSFENLLSSYKSLLESTSPFFGDYFKELIAAFNQTIKIIGQQRDEELGERFSFLFKL